MTHATSSRPTWAVSVLLSAAVFLGCAADGHATGPGANGAIAFIRHTRNLTQDTGKCPPSVANPCGGGQALWLMDADGGNQRRLVPFPAVDPDEFCMPFGDPEWSPDGTKIATARPLGLVEGQETLLVGFFDFNDELFKGAALIPFPLDFFCSSPMGPTWSPDGTKLIQAGADGLYVIDLTMPVGLAATRFTDFGYWWPDWSPDGQWLLAVSQVDAAPGEAWPLVRMPATGGSATIIRNHIGTPISSIEDPDWSPQGDNVVFERTFAQQAGAFETVSACGGEPFIVAGGGGPGWSPDNGKIVYWSRDASFNPDTNDFDTNHDVFTIDASGNQQTRVNLTNTPTNPPPDSGPALVERAPDWQPLNPTAATPFDPNACPGATMPTMTVHPARMTIPDWRGDDEHTFERDPPHVTTYGRTVVPIDVEVIDALTDEPISDLAVGFEALAVGVDVGSALFGFALLEDGAGPETLEVTTDEQGVATVYFHVEDLYSNVLDDEANASAFEIYVNVGAQELDPVTVPVVDNRARLLAEYSIATDFMPDGARSIWRNAFLPPLRGMLADLPGAILAAIVQPGNSGRGTFFCNSYQSRSLLFLNDMRHSEDGWVFNGLDYSPVQTLNTEHHFVALWPAGLEFRNLRTRILDPWLPQTIAVYTWHEFVTFMDTFGGGNNIVPDLNEDEKNLGTCLAFCAADRLPPPYPALGGRYPWFPENDDLPIAKDGPTPGKYDGCLSIPSDWCQRNGFSGTVDPKLPAHEDHATIVIGSPVKFHIVMEDGGRLGFDPASPEALVNDFADVFTTAFLRYPEPEGELGWYVEVPPGDVFTVELPGERNGTADLVVLTTDGEVWGGYLDIPISAGETVAVDIELDRPCEDLALGGGASISCVTELDGPSCGNPSGDRAILPTDALITLRAAVGILDCDLTVCDVNGDGNVAPSDALTILRWAVGHDVTLKCPLA